MILFFLSHVFDVLFLSVSFFQSWLKKEEEVLPNNAFSLIWFPLFVQLFFCLYFIQWRTVFPFTSPSVKKQPAEKTCPLPRGSPFLPGWILAFLYLLILAYGFVSKFETLNFALASSSVAFLVFFCLFVCFRSVIVALIKELEQRLRRDQLPWKSLRYTQSKNF